MHPKTEQFNAAKADLEAQASALGHRLVFHSYGGDHARFLCAHCGVYGAIELSPAPHICDQSDANLYPCLAPADHGAKRGLDAELKRALEHLFGVTVREATAEDTDR